MRRREVVTFAWLTEIGILKRILFHHHCEICYFAVALGLWRDCLAARDFYIVTVHHDGKTNLQGDATHKPEAFPPTPLDSTAGMWVKKPDDKGDWTVRAFVFDPAEVTVQQGDEVRLHFVGVHGGSHTIHVEGVAKPITVKRGTEQVISFKAERAGLVTFTCSDHPPSMRGQVVVMPKT